MLASGVLMVLFGLLVVVGVVLIAIVVIRLAIGGLRTPGRDAATSSSECALQLLQERYARGDLSTEDYEERRRALAEGP